MSEKLIKSILDNAEFETAFATVPNRIQEWDNFSGLEREHILQYTIPQYGDAPNDFMSTTSALDVEQQIKKYVARFGSNARGFEEAQRDLLKIAHYCAMLYNKRIKEKEKDNA